MARPGRGPGPCCVRRSPGRRRGPAAADALHGMERRAGLAARGAGPAGVGGHAGPGQRCPARTRSRLRGSWVPSRWPTPRPRWTRPGRPGRRSRRTGGTYRPRCRRGRWRPAAAAGAAARDAAIDAWDIAMATGQGSPLTPELAQALNPGRAEHRRAAAPVRGLCSSAGACGRARRGRRGTAVLSRPPPRLDGMTLARPHLDTRIADAITAPCGRAAKFNECGTPMTLSGRDPH